MIKTLEKIPSTDSVLFIFCNHKTQHTVQQFLEVLLKQLLQREVLSEEIALSLKKAKSTNIPLSSTEIMASLLKHLQSHSHTFIIIDAFDEVLNESSQFDFLHRLKTLISETSVKVLITSRPSVYEIPQNIPRLEITAASNDIEAYIKSELYQNLRFTKVVSTLSTQEEILCKMLKKASGM